MRAYLVCAAALALASLFLSLGAASNCRHTITLHGVGFGWAGNKLSYVTPQRKDQTLEEDEANYDSFFLSM
jgi:hypothetical protein